MNQEMYTNMFFFSKSMLSFVLMLLRLIVVNIMNHVNRNTDLEMLFSEAVSQIFGKYMPIEGQLGSTC